MRRIVLGCVVAPFMLAASCGGPGGATVGGPTNGPPTSPSTSDTPADLGATTTRACTARDLEASLGGTEGAAGTTYRALVFTNTSGQPCTIEGIPRVSFVAGDDRHQVGADATPAGAVGPVVMLAPAATATAPIGFVNIGNFDPADCEPTDVRGLRVFPPGGQENQFVPFDTTTCGAADFQAMTVRTVHPGAGLE